MKPDWQTEDGAVQLFLGDCLEVLPQLEAECADVVLTDPQFFCPATHYSSRKNWGRAWSDLSPLEHWWRQVTKECSRVLRGSKHFLVFCDSQSYPVFFAATYSEFDAVHSVVWDKGRIGMGSPWRKQHELIMAACAESATPTGLSTVLTCPTVPTEDRVHPAEKPVALLAQLVDATALRKFSSKRMEGVALDCFMGSGTTGVACVRLGRKFIGIEKERKYFDIAVKRITDELNRAPLFDKPPQIQRTFLGETA